MVVTQEIGMTIKINVGDTVKCVNEPTYWDEDENHEYYYDDDEDAMEPDEHPGFNSDMYEMLGHEFVVKEIHKYKPWVKLEDKDGNDYFWWHLDWVEYIETIELSEIDKASKYIKVITKIKKMDYKRKGAGYVF